MPFFLLIAKLLKSRFIAGKALSLFKGLQGFTNTLGKLLGAFGNLDVLSTNVPSSLLTKKTIQFQNIVSRLQPEQRKNLNTLLQRASKDQQIKRSLARSVRKLRRSRKHLDQLKQASRDLTVAELKQVDIGFIDQNVGLQSTWIASGTWIPYGVRSKGQKVGFLTLSLKSGRSYTYPDVDFEVWLDMIVAKGKRGAGTVFWAQYLYKTFSRAGFGRSQKAKKKRQNDLLTDLTKFQRANSSYRVTNRANFNRAVSSLTLTSKKSRQKISTTPSAKQRTQKRTR